MQKLANVSKTYKNHQNFLKNAKCFKKNAIIFETLFLAMQSSDVRSAMVTLTWALLLYVNPRDLSYNMVAVVKINNLMRIWESLTLGANGRVISFFSLTFVT